MTTQHDELELQESIERDVEAMKTFPYAWLQNFAEGKADSKGRPVTEKDVELIARSLGRHDILAAAHLLAQVSSKSASS